MPAVSKAQQRFMGMVYATKKGEMTNPSPEVAKAAASMKKKDARDFASTKHKRLPDKVEESNGRCPEGKYYCYTDKKCKPIPKGFKMVGRAGYLRKENGHSVDDENGKKNGNGNGNGNGGNGNGGNGNGGNGNGGMGEETKYDRYDKEKKQFAKADQKMKFGKFYSKAKEAKNRLSPGEVKRYDKNLGRYVSNKE